MLVEISGNRFINPLSDCIVGIFPNENSNRYDQNPYILNIGCSDGIAGYLITEEDRNIILKARDLIREPKLEESKNEVR